MFPLLVPCFMGDVYHATDVDNGERAAVFAARGLTAGDDALDAGTWRERPQDLTLDTREEAKLSN